MKLFLVLVMIMVVFGGCASAVLLNPNAKSVKISKEAAPQGYEEVGEIFGKSNADDQIEAMEGAQNDLRNKAADLRGNYVVLETNNSKSVMGTWKQGIEILLGGQAYCCSTK